jgi:muconolactone D-isomerase
VEFLVYITVNVPEHLERQAVDALIAEERAHGRRLLESGHLARIWRLSSSDDPAHVLRNVGIWAADDRPGLDRLLSSLPLWPYASVDITDLQTHPLEQS